MRADFAASAERDLRAIHDYIFQDNPAAALRVIDRIEAVATRIARYPLLGSWSGWYDTRAWNVPKTPYRLIYRVETGRIFIVRVVHGAMRWPPEEE